VKLRDGAFLMGHAHTACALGEVTEIGNIPSSAALLLQHAPEACKGMEVMSTMGREAMEAQCAPIVVKGRVELMRSLEPAALDDPHNFLRSFLEHGHDWGQIWAPLRGIDMRPHGREDFGGAIVDGTQAVESPTAPAPAPRALRQPRVPFEALIALHLPWTQGPRAQADTLGCAPPARPRQGQTPDDRFIFLEPNALAPAGRRFQGGECKMGQGQSRRSGSAPPRRPTGA
jgi:hypothetical protein